MLAMDHATKELKILTSEAVVFQSLVKVSNFIVLPVQGFRVLILALCTIWDTISFKVKLCVYHFHINMNIALKICFKLDTLLNGSNAFLETLQMPTAHC
jgi:hypothetical protein